MADRAATEGASSTPIESVGLICARAAFVAILVGLVEGIAVARIAEVPVSGIGLATAGLWFPAALFALLPAALLARIEKPSVRRFVASALVVAFMAALLWARGAKGVAAPLRALPLEAVAAVGLAWAASVLRPEDPLRRPIAIAGLLAAVGLQLFGTRWVDAHRPAAALLVDHTTVPRAMLKLVLRRFV